MELEVLNLCAQTSGCLFLAAGARRAGVMNRWKYPSSVSPGAGNFSGAAETFALV